MNDPGGPTLFDVAPEREPAAAAPAPRLVTPPRPVRVTPEPTGPVLLAVDGNSLIHRAFHAYGPPLSKAGTGGRDGLYGFLALFAGLMERTRADAVVVGFDCTRRSVRRDRWAEYKAQRPPKDPGLYALLDVARLVLADLRVHIVVPEGWEADDVLGSAATAAQARGWRAVLATSDKDAFGLVSDTASVLHLRSGLANAVTFDPRRLQSKVGVRADQYVEFAALRGDTSDNLKGVPGIGPARAKALLRAYDTVADAVADPIGCRSVVGPEPGQTLIDDLESAASVFRRNVDLMTIRRSLDVDLDGCAPQLAANELIAVCEEWNVARLASRLGSGLAVSESWVAPSDADAPPV